MVRFLKKAKYSLPPIDELSSEFEKRYLPFSYLYLFKERLPVLCLYHPTLRRAVFSANDIARALELPVARMGDLIDYEDRYYLEDLKLYDQKFAEEHNIDDNTVFVIKETMLMFICDSRSKRVGGFRRWIYHHVLRHVCEHDFYVIKSVPSDAFIFSK
nr:MAG: hypothetical protein [Apis mellifra filamentous-like virus]